MPTYYKPWFRRDLRRELIRAVTAGVGTVLWILFLTALVHTTPEWDRSP